MQQISHKIALSVGLALSSLSALAEENITAPAGALSGTFSVVSQYIFRGAVENDDVALQAGIEYAPTSAITLGYWGSTLDYDPSDSSADKDHGFEHDFYLSYARPLSSNWSYKIQTTAYYYQDGGTVHAEEGDQRHTTAFDLLGELAYKDLTFSATVMLGDASFANAGDLYLSTAYQYALPQNFTLNSSIGVSVFNDRHDDAIIETRDNVVLSEARIGLAKPIANTPAEVTFDYIWGGKDRMAERFDDHLVLGINFNF